MNKKNFLLVSLCLILSIVLNIWLSLDIYQANKERDEDIDEVNIAWGYIYKFEHYGVLPKGSFDRYRTARRRIYAKRGNSQEG